MVKSSRSTIPLPLLWSTMAQVVEVAVESQEAQVYPARVVAEAAAVADLAVEAALTTRCPKFQLTKVEVVRPLLKVTTHTTMSIAGWILSTGAHVAFIKERAVAVVLVIMDVVATIAMEASTESAEFNAANNKLLFLALTNQTTLTTQTITQLHPLHLPLRVTPLHQYKIRL